MRVSVLLPARESESYLIQRTIRNLRGNAEQPEKVEVLVRLDWDDPELIPSLLRLKEIPNVKAIVGPPCGYRGLDQAWNECAALAQGHWLMLWNCDAEMHTGKWDTYLDQFDAPICVVQPTDNHNSAAFVIFPRKVYKLLGYITRHPFMDWWVNQMIDQGRQGFWPAYADGVIRVQHQWSRMSPRAPEALELQHDLHTVRPEFWRAQVAEDAMRLKERSA